jgi:hypothetical protein
MSSYYYNPYHIFNIVLAMVYPILRSTGIKIIHLKTRDTWGFQREYTILTGICTIIILRYIRYFTSMKKFINEVLFYSKCGNLIMFYFIDFRIACWYSFACIVVWILFKIPIYNGPSKVLYISSQDVFKEKVFKKNKNVKGDNYWFIIFYSNYCDNCIFVNKII